MVLVVGQSVVVRESPSDLEAFLASSSRLREDVDTFKAKDRRAVGDRDGLLYISQHEFAVTHPGDPSVSVVGSEDATTCHVVVLRHPTTGVTALAHLDDPAGCGRNVADLAERIFELSDRITGAASSSPTAAATARTAAPSESESESSSMMTSSSLTLSSVTSSYSSSSSTAATRRNEMLEISLVGGFQDNLGNSEKLSLSLFRSLVRSDVNYVLGLCCIGSLNTVTKRYSIPFPIFYGCAVDVATGDIFPADFKSHGPEEILRHVRCSFNRDGGSALHAVYDAVAGRLEVAPFRFVSGSSATWLKLWCRASPSDILVHMSTSPEVEPDHFVPNLKAAMRMVIDHPVPAETVFKGGRPIRYVRDNSGDWIREEDEEEEDEGLVLTIKEASDKDDESEATL